MNDYVNQYKNELKNLRNCESSAGINSIYTIESYCNDIVKFLDVVGKNPEEITTEDVDGFLKLDSPATANRRFMAINNFYKFLNESGITDNCPIIHKKTFKKIRKIPERLSVHMTIDEGLQFLNEASKSIKNYALMITFLDTGMRESALCNLKKTDWDGKRLRVIEKGNIERVLAVGSHTAEAINEYLDTRNDDIEYLFISNMKRQYSTSGIYGLVERIAKRAEINKKITPHKLRHTCAAMLRSQGNDILTIGRRLGQKDVKTTKRYLEHLIDERDIEAAEKGAFNISKEQLQNAMYQ